MLVSILAFYVVTTCLKPIHSASDVIINKEDSAASPRTGSLKADFSICREHSTCMSVSDCKLLVDLMDMTCVATAKFRQLVCGYRGSEPLVCCPLGASDNYFRPYKDNAYLNLDEGYNFPTIDQSSSFEDTSSGLTLENNCGKPMVTSIQGNYRGLGSQPWVARIGFRNSQRNQINYPCCGTIISRRAILTAAHCALARSEGHKLHSVRVGEYDAVTDPDCLTSFCARHVQDIPVSHVVVHPGYEPKTFRHDVAILVLKSQLNYSVAAQPVCLLQNSNVPLVGRRGTLVGWGKLPGQDETPNKQQQLDLPIRPLEDCKQIYSKVLPVTDHMLCVGGEKNRDACDGFGGAPLVLLDHIRRARYYQVAIASFGSSECGREGVPSVYTSVHKYVDWIRNNMS